jgi:hypothetical protein
MKDRLPALETAAVDRGSHELTKTRRRSYDRPSMLAAGRAISLLLIIALGGVSHLCVCESGAIGRSTQRACCRKKHPNQGKSCPHCRSGLCDARISPQPAATLTPPIAADFVCLAVVDLCPSDQPAKSIPSHHPPPILLTDLFHSACKLTF